VMTETLYMFTPYDDPHGISPSGDETICGIALWSSKRVVKITPRQALVFLKNRRCKACFPKWEHTVNPVEKPVMNPSAFQTGT